MAEAMYEGDDLKGKARVMVYYRGPSYPLRPRRWLINYNCQKYEWGQIGNGASLLGLSILAEEYGSDIALAFHEIFAAEVVDRLPREGWQLTQGEIARWMQARAGYDIADYVRTMVREEESR